MNNQKSGNTRLNHGRGSVSFGPPCTMYGQLIFLTRSLGIVLGGQERRIALLLLIVVFPGFVILLSTSVCWIVELGDKRERERERERERDEREKERERERGRERRRERES